MEINYKQMKAALWYLLVLMFLFSCSDDKSEQENLLISNTELFFPQSGGSQDCMIQSNVVWHLEDIPQWLTVSAVSGDAGKTTRITITALPNTTDGERSTSLNVKAGTRSETITVGQLLTLALDQTSYTAKPEGEVIMLALRANGADYAVTVSDNWIERTTVSGKALADYKETFTIAPNYTGSERNGSIFVKLNDTEYTVTVSQPSVTAIAPDKSGMEMDAMALAFDIPVGWNLGNSLEATGGETGWGNPKTTALMIQKVKAAGFQAVRIPCAWNQYLENNAANQIKASWIARVKEVVDYCIANELYAILNIHWDGGWLENQIPDGYSEEVDAKQHAFWTQIALAFRDYGQRLLFAGCNEPNVSNAAEMATLLRYEQTFIDAVRATGGRNAYRNLIVPGPSTNIDKTVDWMQLVTDPTPDRLMVEVHYYDPWQFCGQESDDQWNKMTYFWGEPYRQYATGEYANRWNDWANESYLKKQFEKMKTTFVDKGVPVILGEYGAMRRDLGDAAMTAAHDASRAYYLGEVTRQAKAHGLVPFVWDAGNSMSLFKRPEMTVADEQSYQAIMKGADTAYPQ